MTRTLEIYLGRGLVGRLEQDDSGSLWFSYDKTWLASSAAVPLSASLPLRREPFRRNECRPFFAGLLPEETSRVLIAKLFGVSDKNDFAILEKIGGECAGAVSLMPPGEIPMAGMASYREIHPEELSGKLAELPLHPLLAGDEGIRLSLAGAQGKLAIAIRDGKFFLPLHGSPSTHILKPQSLHFDHLAENEYFCMKLAANAGLEVAAVEIGKAENIIFLQVERYDRKNLPDGRTERIHQEDFCQAMGIPPELKYQQEGGPNLKKCFDLIRSMSSVPAPDVLRMFDALVFNFLIGNNDAHGKNFSLLYDGAKAMLAPLYDLVCTQAYPNLSATLAMKIGDERKPERVIARNWKKFFKEADVSPAIAVRRLTMLTGRVKTATLAMMGGDHPGAALVAPVVIRNCDRLLASDWTRK